MSLAAIKSRVRAGKLTVEGDVVWKMGSRSLTLGDIREAPLSATAAVEVGARWDVTGGVDLDGNALGAAVRIDLGNSVDVVGLIFGDER